MNRLPTFQEFANRGTDDAYSFPRNAWVQEPGLRIYVRRAIPYLHPGIDFELANLEADEPGKGALTRFLDAYESRYWFRFELVHNERLVAYLLRRGYAVVTRSWEGMCINMEKLSTEVAGSEGEPPHLAIARAREIR